MTRISFCIYTLLSCSLTVQAQVASWLIPPVYERIRTAIGADLVITDSADHKILWGFDGRRLGSTADVLFDFTDRHAVTLRPGSSTITGFFDDSGLYTALDGYKAANGYPNFSCGYLVAREGGKSWFINHSGKVSKQGYSSAYPHVKGYAVCFDYHDAQKQRNPYYLLLDNSLTPTPLLLGGKSVKPADIEFLSSLNDEDTGFAVVKGKVYTYSSRNLELQPFSPATIAAASAEGQATIAGNIAGCLSYVSDGSVTLHAQGAGREEVLIAFDNLHRALSVRGGAGGTYKYAIADETATDITTELFYSAEDGKFGLFWQEEEVLPPQLDRLVHFFGANAFVEQGGRYGMIGVDPKHKISVSLPGGNAITFHRQTVTTTVRLQLPPTVSASGATLSPLPSGGCTVDTASRQVFSNAEGTAIDYSCTLHIPPTLDDDTTDASYLMQVAYNGFLSPEIPLDVKVTFIRHYKIDFSSDNIALKQNNVTFTFNVTPVDKGVDGVLPPSEVKVITNGLLHSLDKTGDSSYRCEVHGLMEGFNIITVQVNEPGCPAYTFPLEVTYFAPEARTQGKQDVTIKKADKKHKEEPKKPARRPRLEI